MFCLRGFSIWFSHVVLDCDGGLDGWVVMGGDGSKIVVWKWFAEIPFDVSLVGGGVTC